VDNLALRFSRINSALMITFYLCSCHAAKE
jgi:hypothetical protein